MSQDISNMFVTWNNVSTAFTGIKLAVTDTASDGASNILDLTVDGVSKFSVNKYGGLTAQYLTGNGGLNINGLTFAITEESPSVWGLAFNSGAGNLEFRQNGAGGSYFFVNGNESTDAAILGEFDATWNNAGAVFSGLLVNITNTASAAASKLMDLKVDGVSQFLATAAGVLAVGGDYGSATPGFRKGSAALTIDLVSADQTQWANLKTNSTITSGYFITNSGAGPRITGGPDDADVSSVNNNATNIAGFKGTGYKITESDGSWTSAGRWTSGGAGTKVARLDDGSTGGAGVQLLEMASAPAAVANSVILYAEDNGSGKTRLMAKFGTGAAQQVAIEP